MGWEGEWSGWRRRILEPRRRKHRLRPIELRQCIDHKFVSGTIFDDKLDKRSMDGVYKQYLYYSGVYSDHEPLRAILKI